MASPPLSFYSHLCPILYVIVTTRKIPFRLSIRDARPLVLEITIRNNAQRERKYVVSIETDNNLSLSHSGLARYGEKKTRTLYPGETEIVTFKIYPRATTKPGEYTVKVTVDECVDSYEHVINSREFDVRVPVI